MNDVFFPFIMKKIISAPAALGITSSYSESSLLRYKQYGKYDAIAVQREGKRLLVELDALENSLDARILRKWQAKYLAWQKKCTQLKCRSLVHGEFNEAGEIILYVQALQAECAQHNWPYTAYYNSVLAHERVHALHHYTFLQKHGAVQALPTSVAYKNAQADWFGAGANIACVRTVKESLAEFIRYLWCKEQNQQQLADAIVQELRGARAYYPSYPYAGVRSLCNLYGRDAKAALQLVSDLWQLSLTSWQDAYNLLKMSDIR